MKTLTMAEAINVMVNGGFVYKPTWHSQTHTTVRDYNNQVIGRITHDCYYAIHDCLLATNGYTSILKCGSKHNDLVYNYMTINGDFEELTKLIENRLKIAA